jgi:hypothetical protein
MVDLPTTPNQALSGALWGLHSRVFLVAPKMAGFYRRRRSLITATVAAQKSQSSPFPVLDSKGGRQAGKRPKPSPPTSCKLMLSIWSMVDPTDGPIERTNEDANTAEELTSESWYWGRISSMSATNLPSALSNKDRRAWRSKLIQIKEPAMPRLLGWFWWAAGRVYR